MNSHESNLKKLGFKVTQPRLEILQLFEKNKSKHLSTDNVHSILKSKGSTIGIATVYRILNQFEVAGIINSLKINSDNVMYELNHGNHHDHIICVKCDKIQEFYNSDIEELQNKISESFGAKLIDHSLNLFVECENCRKTN